MIKNGWEISVEEKSRILNLHESATKRQYLKEQEGETTETFDFSSLYEPGKYMITPQINAEIEKRLNDLLNREEFKNQTIEIKIYAGESQVRNYDLEKTSKTYNTPLNTEVLANRRAFYLKSILEKYFNINKELTGVVPIFSEPNISVGTTPAVKGKKFSDYSPEQQQQFRSEQFVKLTFTVKAKPKEVNNEEPFETNAAAGDPIYLNNHKIGMVSKKDRDTKSLSNHGGLDVNQQYRIFLKTKWDFDKRKEVATDAYIIPSTWWYNTSTSSATSQDTLDTIYSADKTGKHEFNFYAGSNREPMKGVIVKIPLSDAKKYYNY